MITFILFHEQIILLYEYADIWFDWFNLLHAKRILVSDYPSYDVMVSFSYVINYVFALYDFAELNILPTFSRRTLQ